MNKELFLKNMEMYSLTGFGKSFENCNDQEKYQALAKTIMTEVMPKWLETNNKKQGKKQASYLSAEYLMGRALSNNLINMKMMDDIKAVLASLDVPYNLLEEAESDAGLGNGGLGRLAACFLDSAATLNYPLDGYGIRYEFGIFRQLFEDGFQVEKADNWLRYEEPWSVRKLEEAVIVNFSDGPVKAVPYDTPIIGYGGDTINTLRLWRAEPIEVFDFQSFNDQKYDKSVEAKNKAENITKVLYPNDSAIEGKILRLKQQYFFVSSSLQDLVRKHKTKVGPLESFADYNAVQLNDTHPAVAVPEMMRLFMHEGMSWNEAWAVVEKTFAYTNHTIMSEALEQWDVELFQELLPEVFDIIERINKQLIDSLRHKGFGDHDIHKYEIISHKKIRMAWMSIYGTFSTNGVAQIHTDILKDTELHDWFKLFPERFNNKTNGITQRRWLLQSNPELSEMITELLGSDAWITDLTQLKGLEKYADDTDVLNRFLSIKTAKKEQLIEYVKGAEGVELDPNSIFDIQIKRLHEYKRQLLNAFHILDLYYRIKENPSMDIVPRTFIFGAKSAPGYFRAKGVIKYINEIAKLVNNDSDIDGKIKVLFVENYRVSYAERLFPAADLSEQISTAGKEASGTGNMKFMLNGAPTIGTLDGANVEIVEEAGAENNFIFGAKVEEIQALHDSYDPKDYYYKTHGLKRVMDTLIDGTFSDGNSGMFKDLHDSILMGAHWHKPDVYFIMLDFDSYREAQSKVDQAYRDRLGWAKKCWMNVANAGKFSSDRTIDQYAKEIWKIEKN